MRQVYRLSIVVILALSVGPAWADRKIYSPYVEEGVAELEIRGFRTLDHDPGKDGEQGQTYELSYGVNSWWYTALFANLASEPSGPLRYSGTGFENIFQLTEPGEYWIDAGAYLEYQKSSISGQADEFEGKLLLRKDFYPFYVGANLVFNQQFGRDRERNIGFEYAVQGVYPWKKELQFAIEAYGEPGRFSGFLPTAQQDHVLGPVLMGRFNIRGMPGGFIYEAGYLFGLTPGSPHGTVKWVFEYELAI